MNKGAFSKILSMTIAIAMVISMLPVCSVGATAEPSGITIEYPMWQGAYGGLAAADITYNDSYSSHRVQWHSHTSTIEAPKWNAGSLAAHLRKGEYLAYSINVPKAGIYKISFEYGTGATGTMGDMYILPGNTTDIATALLSATPVLTHNFYSETATTWADFNAGNVPVSEVTEYDIPTAGEYIVVWKGTGTVNSIGRYLVRLGTMTFDGGPGKAPIYAETSLTRNKINLAENETSDISVTKLLMSDKSLGDAEDISALTFESSDTSVATISGTTINPVAVGKATIYTKNGDFILCENEVEVTNEAVVLSGVKVIYPMWQSAYGGTAAADITYDNSYSGNRVQWHSHTSTVETPKWNAGSLAAHLRKDEYVAYSIKVPKAGIYKISFEYGTGTNATMGDMYILPGNATDIATALASATPVLTHNFRADTATTWDDFNSGKAPVSQVIKYDIPSAGEYIIVWKGTGTFNSNNRYLLRLGTMTFDGGETVVPMGASFSLSNMLKPEVKIFMSDGTKVDGSSAQVTYESSDESVLKINNETGKFIACGIGKVTVTATIRYNGSEPIVKTVKKEITSDNYMPYSGAYSQYTFNIKHHTWTPPYWTGDEAPNPADIRGITYQYTTKVAKPGNWEWYGASFETGNGTAWVYEGTGGRLRIGMSKGRWVGLTLNIPAAGRYLANFTYCKYYEGRIANDLYLVPKNTADIDSALNESTYIGTFDCLDKEKTELTFVTEELGYIDVKAAGEYILVLKALRSGYTDFQALTLDGVDGIKRAEIIPENSTVKVGDTTETTVYGYVLDGTRIDEQDLSVKYTSDKPHVAEVSENGVIRGISEGECTITARVKYMGVFVSTSATVKVEDMSGVDSSEFTADERIYVRGRNKLTLHAIMKSGNRLVVPESDITYTLTCEPEGIAWVDDEGYVNATGVGVIRISASANFRGDEIVSNEIELTSEIGMQKNGRTLYTDEMQKNAMENIKKYSWAKSSRDKAVATADMYVDNIELVYNHITAEGVPRSIRVGSQNDPDYKFCRYCGVDIIEKYGADGTYAWNVNIITRPWKIQCPDCKRLFPTNDFESFYKLGLDEHGVFNRERALEKHEELFGGTYGVGYLKNELYPEIGDVDSINTGNGLRPGETVETWGVDDGWGYVPKDENGNPYKYSNGIVERHTYIAYYNWDLWFRKIRELLKNVSNAYFYTGDEKYGRAGAIILDRIADIYPDMTMFQYFKTFYFTHGSTGEGKIVGRIQDEAMAQCFAESADILFPMIENKSVIDFLSAKADKLQLENKKESAYDIWNNWKNGILLENYRAVRKADIYGNFGMHQLALAKSAVVLASEPESEEILDFTFKTGGYVGYKKFEVSGGNINSYFVDELDRDGLGYESSPQYNYVAVDRIVEVADALSKYTGKNKEKYNIVNRPKFLQMISAYSSLVLSDSHTAQIGDSQGTATLNFVDSVSNTLIAFKLINGSEYAKYLAEQIYIRSGGDVADLHYDIFTKNPESAKKDVEDFASGPSKPQSELLAGFGFAALRAGEKHKGVSADGNNNTLRSFWIYSGWGKSSHHQLDSLNIGIEAFGLNLSPDLGYPETTGEDANRMQWVNTTLSHNTVVVDEKQQERTVLRSATPLHYDNTERVKLIDMRCEDAYPDIDEYRRTLVMIEAPGDISYGVDFFNVQGGNTHQFSFHAQSTEISETEGLELVPQVDGENNYVGSYAGAEVPGFTPDPDTANTANDVLRYPRGYTWIKNLDRAQNPKNSFAVDFKIKDFRKAISDNREIHLRMTQVNDFSASEVAIGDGYVPAKAVNKELPREIKYAIVRRDGENLKSLFTTVYEPYKDNRYIVSITPVELVPAPADASAKAVCVEFANGFRDYVVYSTDNTITYNVAGVFDFRGFVGVYSVNRNGVNVYRYVNDGDLIGEATDAPKAYSGEVVDFSKKHELENYITVTCDASDAEKLVGRIVKVDNDKMENGTYVIEDAEKLDDNTYKLSIGIKSTIRSYNDPYDFAKGYVYNIKEGQKIEIPSTYEYEDAPVFETLSGLSTSAESKITLNVRASNDAGTNVTYIGKSLPRGMSLDSATGTISWKPDSSQIGINHVAVSAVDDEQRESTLHFNIMVYGSTTSKPSDVTGTPSSGASSGGGGGAAPSETPDKTDENQTVNGSESGESGGNTDDTSTGNGILRFTDLTNHAWATDAINALAADGIIRGTSETTFSPANNITRADFAILLVRAFKLESKNTENFADVFESDYFAKELAILRNTGIVSGIGDNKYAPKNTITRQDMMTIVYRAMQKLDVELEVKDVECVDFRDVSDYAQDAVKALITAGLVNGKNGKIAPKDYTTRAEIAVLLNRILDFTAKNK